MKNEQDEIFEFISTKSSLFLNLLNFFIMIHGWVEEDKSPILKLKKSDNGMAV